MDSTFHKRCDTAKVRAKFLDTDHLNHIGLDMSQWRCKDLVKLNYFREPSMKFDDDCSSSDLSVTSKSSSDLELEIIPNATKGSVTNKSWNWLRFRFSNNELNHQSRRASVDKSTKGKGAKNEQRIAPVDNVRASTRKDGVFNYSRQNKSKSMVDFNRVEMDSPPIDYRYAMPFTSLSSKRAQNAFINNGCDSEATASPFNKCSNRYAERVTKSKKKAACFDDTSASSFDYMGSVNEELGNRKTGGMFFIEISTRESPTVKSPQSEVKIPQRRYETCNYCGNQFGTAGFKIHILRCTKAPETEASTNNGTSTNEITKSSVSTHTRKNYSQENRLHEPPHVSNSETEKTSDQKIASSRAAQVKCFKPIICDICKRKFGSHSIAIHRVQCFKRHYESN